MTSNVTQVAAGWRHACALQAGVVSCWGGGEHGSLGSPGGGERDAAAGHRHRPGRDGRRRRRRLGLCDLRAARSAAGARTPTASSATARTSTRAATPVNVVGLDSGVTAISHNWYTGCAIKNALLYCWGDGHYGMLGNGGAANSNVPVQVPGLSDVTAVATSNTHTCAVANGGVMYCWGSNDHGQLGNEAAGLQALTPVTLTGSLPKPVSRRRRRAAHSRRSRPSPRRRSARWPASGRSPSSAPLTIATVTCPASATCAISAPKTVKVKIARKTYTASVTDREAQGRPQTPQGRLQEAQGPQRERVGEGQRHGDRRLHHHADGEGDDQTLTRSALRSDDRGGAEGMPALIQ